MTREGTHVPGRSGPRVGVAKTTVRAMKEPAALDDIPPFVDGLPPSATVRQIPIADIDQRDDRFQHRLTNTHGTLRKSLLADGQQVPVMLWGGEPPYKIIDGFRRIAAIDEIGWDEVKAIVRDDIGEEEAYALGFIENVKRKNYSPWDKANAIWRAVHKRGMDKGELAEMLGVSARQMDRYLALLDFDPAVQEALKDDRICMAHAVTLQQFKARQAKKWVDRIVAERLSARQLRKQLKKAGAAGRPKRYLKTEKDGFRMYPFRFHADADPAEKEKVVRILEKALAIARNEGG